VAGVLREGAAKEPLINRRFRLGSVEGLGHGSAEVLADRFYPASEPWFGALEAVVGRLTLGRHPARVTARARISQFAEANSMCRWLRFFAIPR